MDAVATEDLAIRPGEAGPDVVPVVHRVDDNRATRIAATIQEKVRTAREERLGLDVALAHGGIERHPAVSTQRCQTEMVTVLGVAGVVRLGNVESLLAA